MTPDLLPELLEPFLAHPERAGIITDFDGTLAPIVEDPAEAQALPGAVELLRALASKYCRVAVVSGRPISFLVEHTAIAPGLHLRGLYGLECARAGEVTEHRDAEPWRAVVSRVARHTEQAAPPGVRVERKGLSVTVHYRGAPEFGPWADAWSAEQADATGLMRHPARMSWELVPPVPVDKGTTVLELADGLDAVCFIGDDRGDLPAFSALDYLAETRSTAVLKVVVSSPEVPPDLLKEADLLVDGPAGTLELLRQFLTDDSEASGYSALADYSEVDGARPAAAS